MPPRTHGPFCPPPQIRLLTPPSPETQTKFHANFAILKLTFYVFRRAHGDYHDVGEGQEVQQVLDRTESQLRHHKHKPLQFQRQK